QGTLRGCKDVRVTLLLAILSYWIIGLPTGYLFANYLGSGPCGYWIGLVLGIGVGALFLGIRLRRVQQRMQLMKL
ncbi:MAG: MATE family efflux transporter, partial [Selenomonadaceae bacterium]